MSFFGKNIKVEIFGESHAEKIGVKIQGLPKGEFIDMNAVQAFCALRAPGQNEFSTPRREQDKINVLSGLDENSCLTGETFEAVIYNTNTRSNDYENTIPRPSHADYPSFVKYGKIFAGGGKYSGRLTACLCIAGGIILQLLSKKGIEIDAHIFSIGKVQDKVFDAILNEKTQFYKKLFATIDDSAAENMKQVILSAREQGDSVGGKIECKIVGLPVGIGDGIFDGLDGHISAAVFGIPAVKGIEFGLGFSSTEILGSENNDQLYFDKTVKTFTNNAGGIVGGMTNGMPVTFTVAFKPTPSIFKQQKSVDLKTNENVVLSVKGRHDPCIVQRAVTPVMSAAAIALYDLISENN